MKVEATDSGVTFRGKAILITEGDGGAFYAYCELGDKKTVYMMVEEKAITAYENKARATRFFSAQDVIEKIKSVLNKKSERFPAKPSGQSVFDSIMNALTSGKGFM